MPNRTIPLSVPNLSGNEMKYVADAVQTEWISTVGAYVERFEQAISKYVGVTKAAAVQSGTAGLHLALLCCGVKPDDEVLVPTLTFVAAVNPVRYVGAHPVFIDCDDSLCMDPVKIERFCEEECDFIDTVLVNRKSKRKVKAVIVVHVFGNMADMEALMETASRYNLMVVEDATEALGSRVIDGRFAGRFAGTIGNVGVYSFNGNKIITSGGGGMVVSQDVSLVERAKHLSTQAKADQMYFVHDEIGYNYRMTNVQAAIGLAQLEQLENYINVKRNNYQHYLKCGIELLPFRESIRPNYWFYSCLTSDRDGLIKSLAQEGIQSRPVWFLIHELEMYKNERAYCIECASEYWKRIVNLPCSSNLKLEEVKYVADEVLKKSINDEQTSTDDDGKSIIVKANGLPESLLKRNNYL